MSRYTMTMIAVLLGSTTAMASDGVGSFDPLPVDAHPSTIPLPAWQRADLKVPEIPSHRVTLAETRVPEVGQPAGGPTDQRDTVGYVEPFDQQLLAAWPWASREDGSVVSHVEFVSSRACGLRLRFENIDRHADIQMRFYDRAATTVLGPFETPRVDDDGGWWSPTIWGDSIGVELFAGNGLHPGDAEPIVTKVAFIHMGGSCANTTGGATLNCHNDVVCSPSWDNNEARGVALMYFVSGSSCIRCTGALLNREPGDLSPLFMTANHCVSSATDADNLEVYWFYETSSCNGTASATPANQPRNLGSLRLKRHTDTDWSLLGLYDPPVSGVLYLGYRSGSWSNNDTATGVHHPRGTFKRISFGDTGGTSNQTFCDSNGLNCFDADVRNIDYTDGTVEPGSSGSPIFDEDRRVRGSLSGGEFGCPNVDQYYGRLDLAFDNLKYFMANGSVASPVFVDDAVGGDPGNNGSSEKGTLVSPFDTVHEASYAVRSGDEMRIEPGSYDERFRIWRPMTLKRAGNSGVVRIGD